MFRTVYVSIINNLALYTQLCLRSSPAESLEYPARSEKRTVRSRKWHSNMLRLAEQSRNSLYCSKIEARPVYISFVYRVNARSFCCLFDNILELII